VGGSKKNRAEEYFAISLLNENFMSMKFCAKSLILCKLIELTILNALEAREIVAWGKRSAAPGNHRINSVRPAGSMEMLSNSSLMLACLRPCRDAKSFIDHSWGIGLRPQPQASALSPLPGR
jgi:hypothetical protein